jgi:hypothetical protein
MNEPLPVSVSMFQSLLGSEVTMESIEIVFCVFWLLMIAAGAGYGLHAILEDTPIAREAWWLLGWLAVSLDDLIHRMVYRIHWRLTSLADYCEYKADPNTPF